MKDTIRNEIPLFDPDDNLQPEYDFDYRKVKPNRFYLRQREKAIRKKTIDNQNPVLSDGLDSGKP